MLFSVSVETQRRNGTWEKNNKRGHLCWGRAQERLLQVTLQLWPAWGRMRWQCPGKGKGELWVSRASIFKEASKADMGSKCT